MSIFYWAVVHRHRGWLAFDNSERQLIVDNQGHLKADAVGRIGYEYRVVRGFKGPKNMTEAQRLARNERLASFFNEAVKGWSADGLSEAYQGCHSIADNAMKAGLTNGLQVSAASKFLWFLRPEGWTIFDDVAATGLGVPPWGKISRSERFYHRLEGLGFSDLVKEANEIAAGTPLASMTAERIVDSLLYLRGQSTQATEVRRLKAYEKALPGSYQQELRRVSDAIVSRLQPHIQKFETT